MLPCFEPFVMWIDVSKKHVWNVFFQGICHNKLRTCKNLTWTSPPQSGQVCQQEKWADRETPCACSKLSKNIFIASWCFMSYLWRSFFGFSVRPSVVLTFSSVKLCERTCKFAPRIRNDWIQKVWKDTNPGYLNSMYLSTKDFFFGHHICCCPSFWK